MLKDKNKDPSQTGLYILLREGMLRHINYIVDIDMFNGEKKSRIRLRGIRSQGGGSNNFKLGGQIWP